MSDKAFADAKQALQKAKQDKTKTDVKKADAVLDEAKQAKEKAVAKIGRAHV